MKEFSVNIEIERNGEPIEVDVMIFDMVPGAVKNSWDVSPAYNGFECGHIFWPLTESERRRAESKAIETLEQQMLRKHESEVDCWIEEMKERE